MRIYLAEEVNPADVGYCRIDEQAQMASGR